MPAFGALATMIMWGMASVGIAVQFIFLLMPWSLGLTDGVDPLVSRTLFWFTGHPLVYFWLLPVYISWYFMLPKQAGGKLFSEPLARLAFLLFIPLSLPVGFHHQFLDPGVSTGYKAVHAFITFGVFMPSMITAFTVLASIESGGRARGGKGRLGWIKSLPWGDPSFTAQVLAMVLFALGGISGLVNASFTVNLVVHNTMFVPGHFHLTVGTADRADLHGRGLLAGALPDGKEALGAPARRRPGVPVVYRDGHHVPRHELGRVDGRPPPDGAWVGSLRAA